MLGGRSEDVGDQSRPARLRTLACDGSDLGERGVDGGDGQRRVRARAQAASAAPPTRRRSGAGAGRPTTRTRRRRPAARRRASPAAVSSSAMRAILASRADEAPTSADAVATSISSTCPAWHEGQTSPSRSASDRRLGPKRGGPLGVATRDEVVGGAAAVRRSRTARGRGSAHPTAPGAPPRWRRRPRRLPRSPARQCGDCDGVGRLGVVDRTEH